MIESGGKTGADTRWSDAGAQTVANVRLLPFNHEGDQHWAAYTPLQ